MVRKYVKGWKVEGSKGLVGVVWLSPRNTAADSRRIRLSSDKAPVRPQLVQIYCLESQLCARSGWLFFVDDPSHGIRGKL
ncbi:hypothetical protein BJX99DRAFT_13149 [Aspergillus californicus]